MCPVCLVQVSGTCELLIKVRRVLFALSHTLSEGLRPGASLRMLLFGSCHLLGSASNSATPAVRLSERKRVTNSKWQVQWVGSETYYTFLLVLNYTLDLTLLTFLYFYQLNWRMLKKKILLFFFVKITTLIFWSCRALSDPIIKWWFLGSCRCNRHVIVPISEANEKLIDRGWQGSCRSWTKDSAD